MRHLLGSLALLGACAPAAFDHAPSAERAAPPAIGVDGSLDTADHACDVALRELTLRWDDAGEPEVRCEAGDCSFAWRGTVDAATELVAAGASVGLLYHRASDPDWWEVRGAVVGAGGPGFTRFSVAIDQHAPGPDAADGEALELIPFLALPDGTRRFDHNLLAGDLENYRAGADSGWRAGGDPYTCTHRADTAALRFTGDWRTEVAGTPRAGGRLAVEYDLDRLPRCRNTHNGHPAWDTTAFVRFEPGGELASGSVRAFESRLGTPTNTVFSVPFEVDVPDGATAAVLWFQNRSGAGSTCETWDSAFGANYSFAVRPAVEDDACAGVERWAGPYGGAAWCPDYEIAADHDARFCELWVDALGDGYEGHYGIPFGWLEAWIRVPPQDGTLLGAGLYVAYRDHGDATNREAWSFGQEVEPGRYKTGFTWWFTGYMGAGSYRHTVERFAFFADVRRPGGEVVRLWQSAGGADYTWDDAFSLPTSTFSIPYGHIDYANEASAVFDARRACE